MYVIETFGAPGCYVPPDTTETDTLAEARAEARRRLGISRLHPARKGGCPDEEDRDLAGIESWCDYTSRQDPHGNRSGGIAIYRKRQQMTKYCTGPRNGNYGYGAGVIPLDAARAYDGQDAKDEATWIDLQNEDWDFDLDEDELKERGLLARLYVEGDTLRLSEEE